MAYRRIAAGKRHGAEVGATLKACKIRKEKFTAPDWAIRSEPGAIHGDPDDLSTEVIFCHAAGDVCVMMLHRKLSLDARGERMRVLR
jgi:hypothetical protein